MGGQEADRPSKLRLKFSLFQRNPVLVSLFSSGFKYVGGKKQNGGLVVQKDRDHGLARGPRCKTFSRPGRLRSVDGVSCYCLRLGNSS